MDASMRLAGPSGPPFLTGRPPLTVVPAVLPSAAPAPSPPSSAHHSHSLNSGPAGGSAPGWGRSTPLHALLHAIETNVIAPWWAAYAESETEQLVARALRASSVVAASANATRSSAAGSINASTHSAGAMSLYGGLQTPPLQAASRLGYGQASPVLDLRRTRPGPSATRVPSSSSSGAGTLPPTTAAGIAATLGLSEDDDEELEAGDDSGLEDEEEAAGDDASVGASSKTSRGPVEAAATARRDHRVLREFLARVAMCVACVAPWLLFGQGSLSHLPSATKTIITWTLLMNAGFGYVSTAIGHRAHPFKGRIGGYRDLIIVNTVSPILYVMMLSHHEHAIWTHTPLANANALTGGGGSTASSSSDGGLPSDALPAAVIPRGTSVGYVVLVMSYFIVLHLSYFAQVFKPCARSVSVSELRNGCTPGAVLAYLLKAAAFAGLLIQHLLFCYRGGVLVSRLLCYGVVVLVLAWITLAIRHRYYLHMHHWFLALLMTPLTQTGSPLLTLIAVGFCAAQFVEGASKWSCAPIWHSRVAIAEASVASFVRPSTPLASSSVELLEHLQRHRLALDDGFGVIADDLDAVAHDLGFSLPDLDTEGPSSGSSSDEESDAQ